jgi:hypothetical protein
VTVDRIWIVLAECRDFIADMRQTKNISVYLLDDFLALDKAPWLDAVWIEMAKLEEIRPSTEDVLCQATVVC